MNDRFGDMLVVSSIDEMKSICNGNIKPIIFLSVVMAGATFLSAKMTYDLSKRVDKLEKDYKNLQEDYHHYVIDHAEYDPDKDEDYDI